ncbi:MAG: hypothetical protein M3Y27_08335 [Acidobacteriota bacterium]|nr:hypothetical protein [Acidobacteriota bacterium]
MIRTFGVFGSADTATDLASPGSTYSLGFTVDNNPQVSNAGSDGFDVAFSDFQYTFGGRAGNAIPESIRFFNESNNGLFTVYFGPESGVDANGNFIPEFAFFGTSLYSGPEANPLILPGTYAVREAVYSDNINYDDQFNPANVITVGSVATPEPSTASLTLLTLLLAGSIPFAASTLGHWKEVFLTRGLEEAHAATAQKKQSILSRFTRIKSRS